MLWAQHPRPPDRARRPTSPNSALNGIVSGIVIEQEQIGPTRYIAAPRRAVRPRPHRPDARRAAAWSRRSAPMLVIPVMLTGSSAYSFEYPQRMAARLGAVPHRRQPDRLCPRRRARHRSAAAQRRPDPAAAAAAGGGCCSTNMAPPTSSSPRSSCRRLYPGGPAIGIFTARYGPDNQLLGRFALRVANSAAIPRMLDEGVRRLDLLYTPGARRRPAPARSEPGHHRSRRCRRRSRRRPRTRSRRPSDRGRPPARAGARSRASTSRSTTPDAGAVQQAEVSVSRVDGVDLGDHHQPRARRHLGRCGSPSSATPPRSPAALQAQGWTVRRSAATRLRISR